MKNKLIIILFCIFILLTAFQMVYAEDNNEELYEYVNIDGYINTLQSYVNDVPNYDLDFSDIYTMLTKQSKVEYSNIIIKILNMFSSNFVKAINNSIIILIVMIINSILSSMQLDEKSDVLKLANLVCYILVISLSIHVFIDVMGSLSKEITTLTTLMQVISPFLMSIIMATGAITTTGVIQPLLLFGASAIGFLVNYIVIPFLEISVALKVISMISDTIKFDRLSNLFSGSSKWIIVVSLTIFLGILSLESSLTSSVDALAVKTTQAAVSNFVPVVGKFFSDSFETVVGATKIVGSVAGIMGIIAILLVSVVPIMKILSIIIVYSILSSVIEPICQDIKIGKYIDYLVGVYKIALGVIIGVTILFVISTGIIFNIAKAVVA